VVEINPIMSGPDKSELSHVSRNVRPAGDRSAVHRRTRPRTSQTERHLRREPRAVVDKQVTETLPDGTKLPAGYVAQSDPPNYPTKTSEKLIDAT
jgi:hypothetical protein